MKSLSKVNLFKRRLEWHNEEGFFKTLIRPIPDYQSNLISDAQYIEFMREIGPIEVNNNSYLVMAVTKPATYFNHQHWWRDTTPEYGEQNFDCLTSDNAKIKDVQLITCDSSLYFWGYDTRNKGCKLIGENFCASYDTSEFINLIEAIIRDHEIYCNIKAPKKFNLNFLPSLSKKNSDLNDLLNY